MIGSVTCDFGFDRSSERHESSDDESVSNEDLVRANDDESTSYWTTSTVESIVRSRVQLFVEPPKPTYRTASTNQEQSPPWSQNAPMAPRPLNSSAEFLLPGDRMAEV